MSKLVVSKHINAPPEDVFQIAIDFRNAAENVRGIEQLDVLTDGPVDVGTRFRVTQFKLGWKVTDEMEVIHFDPPHRYTLQTESNGHHYEVNLRFLPDIAGTCVRLEVEAQPRSTVARLIAPMAQLLMGPIKRIVESDLDDMKAIAEQRANTAEHAY